MVTHNERIQPEGAAVVPDDRHRVVDHHAPARSEDLGHYDLFHDLMVDCRESKRRYRYDHIKGAG